MVRYLARKAAEWSPASKSSWHMVSLLFSAASVALLLRSYGMTTGGYRTRGRITPGQTQESAAVKWWLNLEREQKLPWILEAYRRTRPFSDHA